MDKARAYRAVFSEGAIDFIVLLSKRRQRKVMELIHQLVAHPTVPSDYSIRDESGRDLEHVLSDEFVLSFWIDHAVSEVRIAEIELVD